MLIFDIVLLIGALILTAVFKEQMRLSVEAANREPFKVLMWGVFGGGAFIVVLMIVLSLIPKDRVFIVGLLLLPFLAYLYAVGSVGLVRLIWADAFNIRYIVIVAMVSFGYMAKAFGLPFGKEVGAGIFAFGFGCFVAGLGYYDREQELAGNRVKEDDAPVRAPVAGSTGKLADITPIFKDQSGKYPGAPPEG